MKRTSWVGSLVHGWRILKRLHVHKVGGYYFYLVVCPTCGERYQRTIHSCRQSTQCRPCSLSKRGGLVKAARARTKRLRFTTASCCLDRRCEVCAGTDHQILVERRAS